MKFGCKVVGPKLECCLPTLGRGNRWQFGLFRVHVAFSKRTWLPPISSPSVFNPHHPFSPSLYDSLLFYTLTCKHNTHTLLFEAMQSKCIQIQNLPKFNTFKLSLFRIINLLLYVILFCLLFKFKNAIAASFLLESSVVSPFSLLFLPFLPLTQSHIPLLPLLLFTQFSLHPFFLALSLSPFLPPSFYLVSLYTLNLKGSVCER